MSDKAVAARCRVIMGATSFADAQSAIDLAIELAGELGGELKAYLIEDQTILDYAAMPFARTIGFGGERGDPVTLEAMQAAFRRDARIFRETIRSVAGARTLHWSFEQKRGEIRSLFAADFGGEDIVVIGRRRLGRQVGDLMLLDDTSDESGRLFGLAVRTARRLKVPLHVLIWSQNGETADRRQADLMRSRPDIGVPVTFSTGTDYERVALRTIARESPSALMLSRSLADSLDLDRLLDTARCPALIVAD
jgi:hypothetical protein